MNSASVFRALLRGAVSFGAAGCMVTLLGACVAEVRRPRPAAAVEKVSAPKIKSSIADRVYGQALELTSGHWMLLSSYGPKPEKEAVDGIVIFAGGEANLDYKYQGTEPSADGGGAEARRRRLHVMAVLGTDGVLRNGREGYFAVTQVALQGREKEVQLVGRHTRTSCLTLEAGVSVAEFTAVTRVDFRFDDEMEPQIANEGGRLRRGGAGKRTTWMGVRGPGGLVVTQRVVGAR